MGTQTKTKVEGSTPEAELDVKPETETPAPELADTKPAEVKPAEVKPVEMVTARVLISCRLGKVNDLVQVPASNVEGLRQLGYIDDSPAAVEYAQSLIKP